MKIRVGKKVIQKLKKKKTHKNTRQGLWDEENEH